eukprot:jgi/Phyca11/110442/e_gw1.18.246.1
MPANLTYIGEFCLASLVYHEPYIRLNIPKNHPVFESPLFQHPTLLSDLLAKLRGIKDHSDRLHATGVPPHVAILGEMKGLLEATIPSFFWGGRFRRVPQEFQLPDCSVATLWIKWQCGNATKKIPPLRMLDGLDMPNRKGLVTFATL